MLNNSLQKDTVLNLSKYLQKDICIEMSNSRSSKISKNYHFNVSTVIGILKGYDQLLNLVIDQACEQDGTLTSQILSLILGKRRRNLGLAVLKGSQIIHISPSENLAEISNPFNL